MKYFARVTHGLERVTGIELARMRGTVIETVAHRRLDFTFPGKPHTLRGLRSVDDVYVYAGRLYGVKHTRDALAQIEAFAAMLELDDALTTCEQVRFIPPSPSFAVTPSLRGRRNYSRFEVADAVMAGLKRHGRAKDWRRVEVDEDALKADLDLRLIIEDESCLIGLRLANAPLHRRPYLQETLPGALKAPVAYSLCLLAQPRPGDWMLDALGGVGTTMIEARLGLKIGRAIVGDVQEAAIRAAQANGERASAVLWTMAADARAVPLPSEVIDCFVSDLPWGRQVQIAESAGGFYGAILTEIERLLKPSGRAVLLTEKTSEFMGALVDVPRLRLMLVRQISLYGSHPTIFMLEKDGDPGIQWENSAAWNAFVMDARDTGRNHPDPAVREWIGARD